MHLPEFGVKFPITNIMIFFAVLVLGVVSLSRLPIDLMPQIEPPVISVITVYEGAGAEDVETKVTQVIENNLATISNLDKITSRSMENLSVVSCRFNWGVNLDEASNDIRDKIEFAKRLLPEEIETPIVFKFNTSMIPILFIGVSSTQELYPQLYHLIDKQVSDVLKRVPGVGAVQMWGGLERQINVHIDRARLEAYHLSIANVVERLESENITLPAGNLKVGYTEYTLRVPGEFSRGSQIKDIIIAQDADKHVYLKDIAQVEDAFKEQTMKVRCNKDSGIMLMVQKRSGANTVDVASRIKKELKNIRQNINRDIKFSILMDSSEHIKQSIKDLSGTIYLGGLFVILVVFAFLRQAAPSFIIALTIPFSLIITFIFMYFSGYTLNIMTLSSLAIAIGMVVDNAIVIVDNVYRHRQTGKPIAACAIDGASEVGLAVSASTLTTIIVFLPMVFLTGIVGIMFKQLAAIITITLLASLFTALTFSPMLCSKLLVVLPEGGFKDKKRPLSQKFYNISGGVFSRIEYHYSRLLGWALAHKRGVFAIAIGIFIFSILLLPRIGIEFIPEEDTGDINITVELPPGTRVEETDKIALQIEDIFIKDVPELETIFTRVGQSSASRFGAAFGSKMGSNVIVFGTKLLPASRRSRSVKEISQAIRPKVSALAGVKKIDIQAGSPFSRMLFGGGKPISLEILGYDLEATDKLAYHLKDELSKIAGVVDVTVSRELGSPELQIEIDRPKASSVGLTMAGITDSLRTYFYGKSATKYREGGDEYDIFVRLKDSDRDDIRDIENIPIVSAGGKLIRLDNVAKIVHRTGPIQIERQNQHRIVRVEANTYRRPLGHIAEDIKRLVANTPLPPEITINLGSDIEEQAKSFRDLLLLFVLGGILVYMVMASQFESLRDPFIIMFSVPFAFTGVAFGLYFAGITLSVISFLGLVMLTGIVVNNAIVLVDYINILRRRGESVYEAITTGGKNRLRPVLMTTITTLFGMLPLALSRGEGSELWRPLGASMIGGLCVSTLITLVLVPVLYAVFEARIKTAKQFSSGHPLP